MAADATTITAEVAAGIWLDASGAADVLERLTVTGPAHVLPSPFLVTPAATAAIGAASLAVAELSGAPGAVAIDTAEAGAAVRGERHVRVVGTKPASLWDPVAGDYPTADGWIRLHTNYPHHRAAALDVLGVAPERDAVARAVQAWSADALEAAVVDAGGCAAALRTADAWRDHPHGRHVLDRPLLAIERVGDAPVEPVVVAGAATRPLAGLRVLDLTRVFAGPVATRFLASWGAEVLRVEAPDFDELTLLHIEVGFGKSSCALDLRAGADRSTFESLVAAADVIVHGYRPGAMVGLGYSPEALVALRPGIVVAALSAYGLAGPWRDRRGFDSLVQMSSGIAAEGAAAANSDRPVPLPCQLLDHATGYLLAFGALRALRRRADEGGSWTVEGSLARTAAWLDGLGRVPVGLAIPEPDVADVERWCRISPTPWGDVHHVGPTGAIGDLRPSWERPPSRPGTDPPAWR
jgi:CoA-transferase family III